MMSRDEKKDWIILIRSRFERYTGGKPCSQMICRWRNPPPCSTAHICWVSRGWIACGCCRELRRTASHRSRSSTSLEGKCQIEKAGLLRIMLPVLRFCFTEKDIELSDRATTACGRTLSFKVQSPFCWTGHEPVHIGCNILTQMTGTLSISNDKVVVKRPAVEILGCKSTQNQWNWGKSFMFTQFTEKQSKMPSQGISCTCRNICTEACPTPSPWCECCLAKTLVCLKKSETILTWEAQSRTILQWNSTVFSLVNVAPWKGSHVSKAVVHKSIQRTLCKTKDKSQSWQTARFFVLYGQIWFHHSSMTLKKYICTKTNHSV